MPMPGDLYAGQLLSATRRPLKIVLVCLVTLADAHGTKLPVHAQKLQLCAALAVAGSLILIIPAAGPSNFLMQQRKKSVVLKEPGLRVCPLMWVTASVTLRACIPRVQQKVDCLMGATA